MSIVVPACGVVNCDRLAAHEHVGIVAGLRVVVEPLKHWAPGWTYKRPHGTVVSPAPVQTVGGNIVAVEFDDHVTRDVSVELLTRYHTFTRRKAPGPARMKLLPALPKTHRINDPDVEQLDMFGGDAA